MDPYSASLLAALILAGAAVLAVPAAWLVSRPRVRRAGLACGALSLLVLAFSLSWHARTGHGPTSPEPMGTLALLRAHPIVVAATIADGAALIALALAGRRWGTT